MRGVYRVHKGNSWTVLLIWALLLFASIGGWIANIVKLFGADFSTINGELVLRVVGVFVAPLGVVMGYL